MTHAIDCFNPAFLRLTHNTKCFVDKTLLLAFLNECIATERKYICISRPRCSGKSTTASMVQHYYCKGIESKALFRDLKIVEAPSFAEHINCYHTIFLDFRLCRFYEMNMPVEDRISYITDLIITDIKAIFPKVQLHDPKCLCKCLNDVYIQSGERFVVIIDHYDSFLRKDYITDSDANYFLAWMKSWIYAKDYIALAYMTGLLPTYMFDFSCKFNFFDDFCILHPGPTAQFLGFTEDEVKDLCVRNNMNFESMKSWYDGYCMADENISIYNMRAVRDAITERDFSCYWSYTASLETLEELLNFGIKGLKESVLSLIEGKSIVSYLGDFNYRQDATDFVQDISHLTSAKVFTLLVHYGYLNACKRLTGNNYILTIPNYDNLSFVHAFKEVYKL